jgi:hypothetical protein
MQEITPWLSTEYIRIAFLDEKGNFVLQFLDGVQNVYQIEDCNEPQVKEILADLKKKGIPVKE